MGWFAGRRDKRTPLTAEEMLAQGATAPMIPAAHDAGPGNFRLIVEDVFFIAGRGLVATGQVQGLVHVGSPVVVARGGIQVGASQVMAIEKFRVPGVRSAASGEIVGLLLAGLTRNDVAARDVLSG